MQSICIQKQVKVIKEYDVVVCGGGPAGWVAAVSAARSGKKTALIERYGFLGGTATGGAVVPISGFFFESKRVVGGIAWEFVKRLEKNGCALVEMPMGHVSVNLEYYKLVAQQMVEESGVHIYTNSYLSDCIVENGCITHVIFESKNGTEALQGRCFIDATGDADLCHMAGVPMLDSDGLQPVSLCFVIGGVDTDTDLLRKCIHHNVKYNSNTEMKKYLLELAETRAVPQFGGPWFNVLLKGNSLAVNMTRAEVDATDRDAYAKVESKLRRDMFELVELLREKFVEFKECEIIYSGVNAGIRETRHIKGVHTLTLQDVMEGNEFECPVAHCAHPIDIHASQGSGQQLIFLEKNCYVPYETMVAEGFENLIAAGRCISAEKEPYASLRVQATVMSIGEAAGLIAGLHCETGNPVFALPVGRLKQQIDDRGFVL